MPCKKSLFATPSNYKSSAYRAYYMHMPGEGQIIYAAYMHSTYNTYILPRHIISACYIEAYMRAYNIWGEIIYCIYCDDIICGTHIHTCTWHTVYNICMYTTHHMQALSMRVYEALCNDQFIKDHFMSHNTSNAKRHYRDQAELDRAQAWVKANS